MIYEKLAVAEAINAVCSHRNILPNAGFLQQLRQLDYNLHPPSISIDQEESLLTH